MIGMMNSGSDKPIDFYASQRQSSLFRPRERKPSFTYLTDGRVKQEGEAADSDKLWRDLLTRSVVSKIARRISRDHDSRRSISDLDLSTEIEANNNDDAMEYPAPVKAQSLIELRSPSPVEEPSPPKQ